MGTLDASAITITQAGDRAPLGPESTALLALYWIDACGWHARSPAANISAGPAVLSVHYSFSDILPGGGGYSKEKFLNHSDIVR